MAANPQTKPNDLACESAGRLLPSTSTIAILLLLSPKADTHFTVPRRAKGWVDLCTAVKVCNPCPRLYIAAAVVINTTARGDSNLGPITRAHRTSGALISRLWWLCLFCLLSATFSQNDTRLKIWQTIKRVRFDMHALAWICFSYCQSVSLLPCHRHLYQ